MLRCYFLWVGLFFAVPGFAQPLQEPVPFLLEALNDKQQLAEGVSVTIVGVPDSVVQKTIVTDEKGVALVEDLPPGSYVFKFTGVGYQVHVSPVYTFPITPGSQAKYTATLLSTAAMMQDVTVIGSRPFVQHVQGKVLINVDAAVTNAGTTVLELLEKSPGVMVDKNGTISLQAKTGVLVLIDDKPTYLSGTELSNLLGSMSSSQVDQIELMANPPAKYDASGNAGIINIKTKKNKQKGFNGSLTVSGGQGRYYKNNNSLVMNYRNGRFNSFLTYSMNLNKYYTDIYAYRRYFDPAGNLLAVLDQPTYFKGRSFNNTLKTGVDYYLSDKTTVGFTFTTVKATRKGDGQAEATWLNAAGRVDSAVATYSNSHNRFQNTGLNFNLRHSINKTQDLSFDVDWLNYDIANQQLFENRLLSAGGYSEASKGNIPSGIHIFSGKADHSFRFGKNGKLESGWKSSRISTDNLADYQLLDGNQWQPDLGKSNHFLYTENIHALYSSFANKFNRISMQAGLRYEHTSYNANQLGNPARKDSAFSRKYQGLFPSGYVSYQVDSAHSLTFTAGRRIDRPAFQKLNPFIFIMNKYTYQTGNPFFLPQYSWNMELSHQFKELFTTAVSYSTIKNYFSQLFLTDTAGILYYSEGNVGRVHNVGVSLTVQAAPLKWWSFTSQAIFNHKELKGYLGNDYSSSIDQFNINLNNQFRLNKIYTAELSGFYTSRARNDLQELLYPTGQLSIGMARPVLKKKATLKISMRDLFYTQAMEGLTQFQAADEYFILRRDTRVFNLSLTWRFGKPLKTIKRAGSGAGDEMQRVGNG
ncbi:MAG: TonB-dependent receptor [Ferruginibacter sp.]|nr:TonB-dependent receptor [Ferruginibacter sp.]